MVNAVQELLELTPVSDPASSRIFLKTKHLLLFRSSKNPMRAENFRISLNQRTGKIQLSEKNYRQATSSMLTKIDNQVVFLRENEAPQTNSSPPGKIR